MTTAMPAVRQVLVDRRFVGEHELLIRAVRDAHDVDVAELGAALAPVRVGHDVVPPNLATGVDSRARRDGPVEQRVVPRHALAGRERLDVFEERREAPDHAFAVQPARDVVELVAPRRRLRPRALATADDDLVRRELALERRQHAPLEVGQRHDVGVEHCAGFVRPAAGLHPAPPHVPDAEREQPLRRHEPRALRADLPRADNAACFSIENPCGS